MKAKERDKRLAAALESEEAAGQMGWWWLSFSGDDSGFLGVCIVEAFGMASAVRKAHQLGINPGGEVVGCQVSAGDPAHANRLLTREEALAIGGASTKDKSAHQPKE
jgi:hypothetical protein